MRNNFKESQTVWDRVGAVALPFINMAHICKILFGRNRAFDCKMSGAKTQNKRMTAFLPYTLVTPRLPPTQVCQLPCKSELGQMVSGKKCLLTHSSEQNEQMPAEPPITVMPTGGVREGLFAAKPPFIASSVAFSHSSVFLSCRFPASFASGCRAKSVFLPALNV